ncbi:MAG: VanW family protein, partial [Fimbriimonadales bacterium]
HEVKTAITALAVVGVGGIMVAGMLNTPPENVVMASYATTLEGRMTTQRLNAELALDKLDGAVIEAGETFSFNKVVGTWSRSDGYRKAPVSFNGQLIWTWGGGVCQTSTTLYNAMLLAGLDLVERNRHRFAPGYVAAGRDAAVAYSNIDLRFRNPYPWPVTIHAETANGRLVCTVSGKGKPSESISVVTKLDDVRRPETLVDNLGGVGGRVMNPGKAGYSVTTYRVWRSPAGERREMLSKDTYPPMEKVVRRGDG